MVPGDSFAPLDTVPRMVEVVSCAAAGVAMVAVRVSAVAPSITARSIAVRVVKVIAASPFQSACFLAGR